jgi:hypothetical protein
MGGDGRLTAEVGSYLDEWLAPQGYEVLYDHGQRGPHVGSIVSWFGTGDAPTLDTELCHIDIAVVQRSGERARACALIEIEESSDRPKSLVGDLLCTLMGDHVTFGGKELRVDERTALIVLAHSPDTHQPRMSRIVECVQAAQPKLLGRNKAIGSVYGELFRDEAELKHKVRQLVGEAVAGRG